VYRWRHITVIHSQLHKCKPGNHQHINLSANYAAPLRNKYLLCRGCTALGLTLTPVVHHMGSRVAKFGGVYYAVVLYAIVACNFCMEHAAISAGTIMQHVACYNCRLHKLKPRHYIVPYSRLQMPVAWRRPILSLDFILHAPVCSIV